jgi:hypothetical protein
MIEEQSIRGFIVITTINIEPEVKSIKEIEKKKEAVYKNVFELAGIGVALFIAALLILSFIPNEIGDTAFKLLNSNLIITLIGAVVAPWIAKTAKDKIGLDITSSEIEELLSSVKKAAELTRRDYDKLRDENGTLPEHLRGEAKNHALKNIKDILGEEKTRKILEKVGYGFLDKAIDEYVASDWQKRFPIEKEQVKDLVSIAVDTIPKAKQWSSLSTEEQEETLENAFNNLKELLDGVGIRGWGKNVLESFIKAYLNK